VASQWPVSGQSVAVVWRDLSAQPLVAALRAGLALSPRVCAIVPSGLRQHLAEDPGPTSAALGVRLTAAALPGGVLSQ
jgi:hypothetical protein